MLNKQLARAGGATICPVAVIVRDQRILLGMRNYTPDKWKAISVWTMPGGRCDLGETVEQTLRREVREEVGITDLHILDYIGELPGAKEGDTILTFFCTTTEQPVCMEPEKFSEWRWVPIREYASGAPYDAMNQAAHKFISEYLAKRGNRASDFIRHKKS